MTAAEHLPACAAADRPCSTHGGGPAQPNDRLRGNLTRVLNAADRADLRLDYVTAYWSGGRITVQRNHEDPYTREQADALAAELGLPVRREPSSSGAAATVVYGESVDFLVEVYIGFPR